MPAKGQKLQFERIRNDDSAPEGYKICRMCRELLSHENFHFRKASPDQLALYCRGCEATKKLKNTYGLTNQDVLNKMTEQEGRCPICSAELMIVGYVIDHDHNTDIPRSLLCSPCNLMIGIAKENQETLINAAFYLGRWNNNA